MEKKEKSHAESNAEGHAESILELYRAYNALEEGAETAKVDREEYTSADDLMERVMETPLSINVRTGWYNPGDEEGAKPEEFQILLSTGGPALRIYGDIGGGCELQHQDWGTPWTDYRPDVADEDDWQDALDWFVGCFYLEG